MPPNTPNMDNFDFECPHLFRQQHVPGGENGGYGDFKICVLCNHIEGRIFIDKEHEINYLKNMLDDGTI